MAQCLIALSVFVLLVLLLVVLYMRRGRHCYAFYSRQAIVRVHGHGAYAP